MNSTITFEVIYDPSKEKPDEIYHTIIVTKGTKLHLIKIPSELAEDLPAWSILKLKSNPALNQKSSDKLIP